MKSTRLCSFDLERASSCSRFFFCALVAAIFLLFCVGTVFLVAFIVIQPKAPLCDLRELRITSFHVDNTSLDRDQDSLLLNVDMQVNVTTHNAIKKEGIWYEPTTVLAFLDEQLGGKDIIPPFHQVPQQTSELQAFIQARELLVSDKMKARLQETSNGNRTVDVNVEIHVRARVRILEWVSHLFKVNLECDVSVSVPEAGQVSTVMSKDCQEKRQWLSRS